MSDSNTTTNHNEIRKWVEARNGSPAVIRTRGEGGLLRIDFGEKEEEFDEIDWDAFFRIFDENNLAFSNSVNPVFTDVVTPRGASPHPRARALAPETFAAVDPNGRAVNAGGFF